LQDQPNAVSNFHYLPDSTVALTHNGLPNRHTYVAQVHLLENVRNEQTRALANGERNPHAL
jgi:hypothetical protein